MILLIFKSHTKLKYFSYLRVSFDKHASLLYYTQFYTVGGITHILTFIVCM